MDALIILVSETMQGEQVKNTLVLLRNELRAADNPLFNHAVKNERRIIPVLIIDSNAELGPSNKWWLHQSIRSLNLSLKNNLIVRCGDKTKIIPELIDTYQIDELVFGNSYNPLERSTDNKLKKVIEKKGVESVNYETSLLLNPSSALKKDGTPYKVYTPFYRQLYQDLEFNSLRYNPVDIKYIKHNHVNDQSLIDKKLLSPYEWHRKFEKDWCPGELGAMKKLKLFVENNLIGYSEGRNRPDLNHVSLLSPHIRFGEISPRQILEKISNNMSSDKEVFFKELVWREFSYHLLFHFPHLTYKNLQPKFDKFPWLNNRDHLKKWQRGLTGYPIVDAGMRQLWNFGYMHNRVRMIVGSFLVKNLLIHWHHGRDWFNYTLLDADSANNNASWQWVAGTGADAAPYFRIFNPTTQGKKFDPHGNYIKKHVPELSDIPKKFIHEPWLYQQDDLIKTKSSDLLKYPDPIVDLKESRQRALDAFKSISK